MIDHSNINRFIVESDGTHTHEACLVCGQKHDEKALAFKHPDVPMESPHICWRCAASPDYIIHWMDEPITNLKQSMLQVEHPYWETVLSLFKGLQAKREVTRKRLATLAIRSMS